MPKLDQKEFVLRNDPKGMYALTVQFPNQCRQALEIAEAAELELPAFHPKNVVLTGLGGSAAGGDICQAIFEEQGTVPFSVNRDYSLPSYVDSSTLVFAASYSGNTEETLAAYASAKERGAKVIAITSGGKLGELAGSAGDPVIRIPGGQPPRTALGFMLVPVLAACVRLGYLDAQPFEATFALLNRCAFDWAIESPQDANPTKQLAAALHGKLPILYGLGRFQGLAAYRWKGQINENAKNMCFTHAFPELNHNEILGWLGSDRQGVQKWAVVYLEDGRESAKMKARARVTQSLIGSRAEFYSAKALGDSLLERSLSLLYFGDFVSIYLAALNEVDPENIDWLNELKAELAQID